MSIKKTSETSKLILLFILFSGQLLLNLSSFSQNSREAGLDDRYFAGNLVPSGSDIVRIYQASQSMIKFDVPDVNFVKISIYDKKSAIVRTYLFNNLREGTYEISTSPGNFRKGTYNCVLQTENVQESSIIIIN